MTEKPPGKYSKKEGSRQRAHSTEEQLVECSRQSSATLKVKVNYLGERGWSGRKRSQGLFSSTLYPGTDLDSTERLEASFLGVAALSLDLCLPWKGSSWLSGRPSPSDTLPEELSWRSKAQTKIPWNSHRLEWDL